jgi:hypothetical protein
MTRSNSPMTSGAADPDDGRAADDRTEPPRMPGPTGDAPLSTESVGDPDAVDPSAPTQGGAAAGAVLGTLVAGPIGLVAGAAAGAVAGSAAGAGRDDDLEPADAERIDDRQVADASPRLERGAPTSRPVRAGDDIPVIDALTETLETQPD